MRVRFIYGIITIILIVIVIFAFGDSTCCAQTPGDTLASGIQDPAASDSIKVGEADEEQVKIQGLNQESMLMLLKHAGEIGTVTLCVLAFGIFLIIRQALQLQSDAGDSGWVLSRINNLKIDSSENLTELEKLISELKGAHNIWSIEEGKKLTNLFKPTIDAAANFFYRLSSIFMSGDNKRRNVDAAAKTTVFALFSKLYEIFKATRDTDGFNSEAANYIQYLKDKFNPFLTRLAFLSDTAGALGLLGTVWGMFLTFFSGSMEQKEIITGMGIALSTTIIGIVVSLILNTFATLVSNKFDAHLEIITKMTNDFQIRLLRLGLAPISGGTVFVESPPHPRHSKPEPRKQPKPEFPEPSKPKKVAERIPHNIAILSKQRLEAKINTKLADPLMVIVKDRDGIGIDGVTVAFELDPDSGMLNGGVKKEFVQTEGGGIAKTNWTLGTSSGQKIVRVTADGLEAKSTRIFATVLPGVPKKLIEVIGNYQIGRPGEELKQPLTLRIEDEHHNPVPGVFVTFKIKEGKGRFQHSRGNECYVETNDKGSVEVYFRTGEERGITKILCQAKNMSVVNEFQIFAQ